MIRKLNEREKRTLKIGAVCAAAILIFAVGAKWHDHWTKARQSLAQQRDRLKAISVDKIKQAGLLSIVPTFEMPRTEERQKFLFRDKFNEQLKKAGIKSEALQFLPIGKSQSGGYRLLRLQCRHGKCKFEQILTLLAGLKENPYLVAVEELKIECDPKKRQEFKLDITVSTFVKSSEQGGI